MDLTETEERIAAFSSLADPTRRRLYLYAVSRPEGAGRDEAAAAAVLQENGFEPRAEENACLVLGNCPFSPLAREYTDLVCRANLALMQGLASGLRIKGVEAVLELKPGRCCVAFQTVMRAAHADSVPVQR